MKDKSAKLTFVLISNRMFINSKFLASCTSATYQGCNNGDCEPMPKKDYDRMMSQPLNRSKGLSKAQLIEMFGEEAYNKHCARRAF